MTGSSSVWLAPTQDEKTSPGKRPEEEKDDGPGQTCRVEYRGCV